MTFHFKTCIYFEERCPLPLGYNNGSYTASLPVKKEKICWTSIYGSIVHAECKLMIQKPEYMTGKFVLPFVSVIVPEGTLSLRHRIYYSAECAPGCPSDICCPNDPAAPAHWQARPHKGHK